MLLAPAARADYQVPMWGGQLQDDERAAVISILAGGAFTGRAVGRWEGQVIFEAEAKVELWKRGVERAWLADAAEGYFDMPPPGEAREHLFWRFRALENEVLLYTLPIEMAPAPVDALYRIVDERIPVGRLKLPGQAGELLFTMTPLSCGSVGCDSRLLLKRRGEVVEVGHYYPAWRGYRGGCAIVLDSRTNGFPDLLELGNIKGSFVHRWDGDGYDSHKLKRRARTTCCRAGMDPVAATRCPKR